jgi:hypothetical protein
MSEAFRCALGGSSASFASPPPREPETDPAMYFEEELSQVRHESDQLTMDFPSFEGLLPREPLGTLGTLGTDDIISASPKKQRGKPGITPLRRRWTRVSAVVAALVSIAAAIAVAHPFARGADVVTDAREVRVAPQPTPVWSFEPVEVERASLGQSHPVEIPPAKPAAQVSPKRGSAGNVAGPSVQKEPDRGF